MSPAIVVGILVAAGEARSPFTQALLNAAAEALDADVSLVVRVADPPSDGDALSSERELRAAAVVQVTWSDADRATVHLRVHVARHDSFGDRFIDRRMTFAPADTMVERGRAVGFTTASILLLETEVLPRREATPATAPPAQPSASSTAPPPTAVGSATRSRTASSSRRVAVDLLAGGAVGLGGPATALGAAAHLEYGVAASPFWLRAGGGLRQGSFPRLDGDDRVSWGAVGAAWRPEPRLAAGRLGGALCLELGLMLHQLSHRTLGQPTAREHHLLPGARVLAEATWRATPSVSLVVTGGVEAAFGVTEVWVANQQLGTIPPLRGLAALGVRMGW